VRSSRPNWPTGSCASLSLFYLFSSPESHKSVFSLQPNIFVSIDIGDLCDILLSPCCFVLFCLVEQRDAGKNGWCGGKWHYFRSAAVEFYFFPSNSFFGFLFFSIQESRKRETGLGTKEMDVGGMGVPPKMYIASLRSTAVWNCIGGTCTPSRGGSHLESP